MVPCEHCLLFSVKCKRLEQDLALDAAEMSALAATHDFDEQYVFLRARIAEAEQELRIAKAKLATHRAGCSVQDEEARQGIDVMSRQIIETGCKLLK